jgi:hypothetical protein
MIQIIPQTTGLRRSLALAIIGLTHFGILSEATLEDQMLQAIEVAEERYEFLATTRLSSNSERFVNYTNAGGTWRTQSDATWTSGFLPGNFWMLYHLTGNTKWADYAALWDSGVRSRATATDNDTGFQIFESFGSALEWAPSLVDVPDYTSLILTAAQTVTNQRYNATIGAYRGWPERDNTPTDMPFEVIVDMLMNLEIILWAGENGGPAEYVDYAIQHADTSWRDNVREDGSTYHVVIYNGSGEVTGKRTHQGWTRDSTWSRGQAWAVYGYTMLYRYTGLPRMLERAEICFDYFVAATDAQTWDGVPYSDFDAPVNSNNPRDASAAAIVASAALELYQITGEAKYIIRATHILDSLTRPPYVDPASSYESLVEKASEKWGNDEVGAIFADFYLLESMIRYRDWLEDDRGTWYGTHVQPGFQVDTGSWLGTVNIHSSPWLYHYDIGTWFYFDETNGNDNVGDWIFFPNPVE